MSTPASNSFSVSRSTSLGSTAPTIVQPSAIEIAEFTTGLCALASRSSQSRLTLAMADSRERLALAWLCSSVTQMGLVRHRAQDDQEADASQATGDQDRVAQDNARPHRENRGLGETDAERASELLRCLGQPPEPVVVLQQGEAALARIAQAAQPNGTPQLGEVHPVRRLLLSANQNDTPAALSPLRRHNPRKESGALAAHD